MRILVAHNYYKQPGGEDTTFLAESALLRDHGHDVAEYIEHNDRIDDMSAAAVAAATYWSRESYRKITARIDEFQPDVVHFHNTFPLISPAAYYACQARGVPVVQTIQNYRLLCPAASFLRDGQICELCLGRSPLPGIAHRCYHDSWLQSGVLATMLMTHRLRKTWHRQVDKYILLTEFARAKFMDAGFPAEKLAVKPNTVHPAPTPGAQRGEYALFVGRLAPEKGVHTLLQAWQTLSDIPLQIVGSGPLAADVQAEIDAANLDHVAMMGFQPPEQIPELMRGARFLVFPSEWYEGFPLTIVEAFACGLPVIGTRLGAMRDMIDEGRSGLFFAPGDAVELAAQVRWAWTHPEEVEAMGRGARRQFETLYATEKNYAELMEIYTEVIQSKA